MQLTVPLTRLPHAQDLPLPAYATSLSAGLDLMAAIEAPLTLNPGQRILVPTGLQIALPAGYEAQIRPRSGLALKEGLTVLNTPGTIDADYRGEIKIILMHLGQTPFVIERGMRIAQMVIAPVTQATWQEVADVTQVGQDLNRVGGFGSSGV